MKFLVDAQLPPNLASWLGEQGHEAKHVQEVGMRDDELIWSHALGSGAIIVTKDEDFADRSGRDPNSPIILWLRIGNSTNPALLEWLQPRWPDVLMLLDAGHRLVEVR